MDSHEFWLAVITAILAAIPPCILALRNGRKVDRNHEAVNGRLTELKEVSVKAAKAEGVLEGLEHRRRVGDEGYSPPH